MNNNNNWYYQQNQNPLLSTLYQQQQFLQPPSARGKTFVCKLFFPNEEEIRRVKLQYSLNYEGLLTFLEGYLKPLFGENSKIHKMSYRDDEEEWINFSSEIEWKDCLDQLSMKSLKIVKLKIVTKDKKKKPLPIPSSEPIKKDVEEVDVEPIVIEKPMFKFGEQPQSPKKEQPLQPPLVPFHPIQPEQPKGEVIKNEGVVHNFKCDICGMNPIKGVRYNCTTKKDFDLCENCFNNRSQHGLVNEGFDVYKKPDQIEYTIPAKKMAHTVVPRVVEPNPKPTDKKMTSSQGGVPKEEPKPITEEPVDEDLAKKIELLKEMGFHDTKKSLILLKKHNGDLQAVVREHLQV